MLNLVPFLLGFLVAICCLIMSALTAIATHIEPDEGNREKLLSHSQYWLVVGIAGITAAIPAILFKTNQMTLMISYIILLAGLIVAFIFEFKLIFKSKPSQSQSTFKSDDDTQPKDL
jgi:undecaprenyl pyrophosphate phosphatase UppP